jgi:hypothetical protein
MSDNQLKTEKTTIDGVTYEVTQLMAEEGLPIFARFLNVIAPAFERLGDLAEFKAEDLEESPEGTQKLFNKFARIIGGMLRDPLLAVHLTAFTDAFKAQTQVHVGSGKVVALSSIYSVHFAGRYPSLVKWLWFCLQLNLGKSFLLDAVRATRERT